MKFRPAMKRLVALMASFVLIPEALFFLALSVWKGNRFLESVSGEGTPLWYSFSSSIFLLTASCFCVFTCRDLWKKAKAAPEEGAEIERPAGTPVTSRAAHRLTLLWLSVALSMCMFVLPLLLVIMGAALNRREEVSWLIGIPVSFGVMIFFVLLWLRKKHRKNS